MYTLVFWKLESREKLKNVTWGQNAWLSSYKVKRDRFIPITTLCLVSCWKLPALVMCGDFRGTSPALIFFLQCCGRKQITTECQHCKRLIWDRAIYCGAQYLPHYEIMCLRVIVGTSGGYNSFCHSPPQLSFLSLVPADPWPSNC